MTFRLGEMRCRVRSRENVLAKRVNLGWVKIFGGTNFPKIFTVDSNFVSPLSSLTSSKIGLAWVQWPLCRKPGNDGKCWIFIGWVTISQRISAVSRSKVTNSSERLGDTLWIVCWCDVSFRRYAMSNAEVAKSGQKCYVFAPQIWGERPKIFWKYL